MHQLHKISTLKSLAPRRDPYWGAPLSRGRFVGLRRLDAERSTWIARYRNGAGRQQFKSLGYASPTFGFDEAKAAAAEWFATLDDGAAPTGLTVEAACRAYVADRRRESGEAAAHDIDMRFRRTVYGLTAEQQRDRKNDRGCKPHPIAAELVTSLTLKTVKAWRDSLVDRRRHDKVMHPRSVNRNLAVLKAALNLAVAERSIDPKYAREWGDVPLMTGGIERTTRDVFLDVGQRRKLIEAITDPCFRDFVLAGILTGARVGELMQVSADQFDARTGTVTFKKGKNARKTGARSVPLNTQAVDLFKRLAKGKAPDELVFLKANGTRWHHSDYDHLMRIAVAGAHLPAKTIFYTLRHSWISQALMDGMGTFEVAKMTGTSLAMIEQHYGHLVVDQARARLKKVDLL